MTFYSIIKKSQLESGIRLDAEFYNPEVRIDFSSGNWNKVDDVLDFVQYGTSEELNEDCLGFPTLRLNEFDGAFIEKPQKFCNRVSEKSFMELQLRKDDILICRTNGNPRFVGKSAIVMNDNEYIFASYLFRVRAKKDFINSASLMIYLNSRIGRSEIDRYSLAGNQTNFSPASLREIRIPVFSKKIQKEIKNLVALAYELHEQSKSLYQQAESLLLEELGLKDFKNNEKLFSVVNLSEVEDAKRMDAEYFQVKYKILIEKIRSYSHKSLEEIIENIPAKFDASKKSNETFRYIELSNVDSSLGVIDGFSETLGKDAPGRAKRILKAGDIIVSSVEGSLEKVALVNRGQEGSLASTGFFQLRSEKLLPEVLLIIAKSIIFKMQLEKQCAGTILTAVPKESIKSVIVPILSKEIQEKISELVRQSHEARKKSKELLEEAKRKVEDVIEKGGEKR